MTQRMDILSGITIVVPAAIPVLMNHVIIIREKIENQKRLIFLALIRYNNTNLRWLSSEVYFVIILVTLSMEVLVWVRREL